MSNHNRHYPYCSTIRLLPRGCQSSRKVPTPPPPYHESLSDLSITAPSITPVPTLNPTQTVQALMEALALQLEALHQTVSTPMAIDSLSSTLCR